MDAGAEKIWNQLKSFYIWYVQTYKHSACPRAYELCPGNVRAMVI